MMSNLTERLAQANEHMGDRIDYLAAERDAIAKHLTGPIPIQSAKAL